MKAVGIAPGRLDFLGGVADYSGSLVLEMPLSLVTKVTLRARAEPGYEFRSAQLGGHVVGRRDAQAAGLPDWVRYPYGCLRYFSDDTGWRPPAGLSFEIESTVPLGMGVSSSAAIEVATLRALTKFAGQAIDAVTLAHLAQRVENRFVGAPCGLMDQLTSACGVRGALLPILCRPDILERPVRLPADIVAVGWPSGVKHAVSASPYATARTAAFMGRRILEQATGRRVAHLAEFSPADLAALPEDTLPVSLPGREFVRRWQRVVDPLSEIVPGRRYPIRAATRFPVEENARVARAVASLRSRTLGRAARAETLGQLLYASHDGYGAMGLGCPETDAMVEAIRRLGPKRGFFGARVSGGGSGGTVVVLLERGSLPQLESLAKKLRFRKDFSPRLLF